MSAAFRLNGPCECGHAFNQHGPEQSFYETDSNQFVCLECPDYENPKGAAWHRYKVDPRYHQGATAMLAEVVKWLPSHLHGPYWKAEAAVDALKSAAKEAGYE